MIMDMIVRSPVVGIHPYHRIKARIYHYQTAIGLYRNASEVSYKA